ncbi:hypothetical protein ACKKBF_B03185 [Auxenochlorella protothecoides x Auxenochlorella symbiontica]
MTSRDYADGTVLELRAGRLELDSVLASATARRQPVLVQFSASWCGPCRMMTPVVAELARAHTGRLVAVKVDIEAGPPNKALAAALRIQSLPTFQLYRDGAVADALQGANRAGLSALVSRALAEAGPAPDADDMAARLAQALGRVKAATSREDFHEAARVLLRFVGNVLDHRDDAKYRRVKLANPVFASKLGSRPGGVDAMKAIGFVERMEAAEGVLIMDTIPDQLERVKQLLEAAMSSAAGGGQAARAASGPAGGGAGGTSTSAAGPAGEEGATGSMSPTSAPPPVAVSAETATGTNTARTAFAVAPTSAAPQAPLQSPGEQARTARLMAKLLAAALTSGGGGPSTEASADAAPTTDS